MDPQRFKKLPVMGILRGIGSNDLLPLLEAACKAGLETMEITMNTPGAGQLIKDAVKNFGSRLCIGAGTVLDISGLKSALDAGASFIVTPVFVEAVTAQCIKNKIPVFPGALTPSEVYRAWQAGAIMVKIFPAKVFGPGYFKELKGPFKDIQLLACGGVTPENMQAYFDNGANAITFGASVFKKELLEKKDYAGIAAHIAGYICQYKKAFSAGS